MFSASQRKPPAAGPSTRRSLVGATLKKSGLIDGDAKMSEAGGSRAAGLPARPGARPDGHRKRIFERAKVAEKDQGGMLHPRAARRGADNKTLSLEKDDKNPFAPPSRLPKRPTPDKSHIAAKASNAQSHGNIALLKQFVESRYDPQRKFLNLENLSQDPFWKTSKLFAPDDIKASRDIGAVLLKLASQLKPPVETVSFANNGFKSLKQLTHLNRYLPNLVNLSLQNNSIAGSKEVIYLAAKGDTPSKLREVVFLGNPFQKTAKERDALDTYRSEIIRTLPGLEVIDMEPIAKIGFDVPAAAPADPESIPVDAPSTFPVEMGPSLMPEDTQGITSAFLIKFFPAFDTDRAALVNAYAPNATFSYSANTTIPPRARIRRFHTSAEMPQQRNLVWESWTSASRNLSRVRNVEHAVKILSTTATDIVTALQRLPATQHDVANGGAKFLVDAWLVGGVVSPQTSPPSGAALFATVHGEFTETESKGIRSFDRTFILVPPPPGSSAEAAGWPLTIISDQLVVRAYSSPDSWAPGPISVQEPERGLQLKGAATRPERSTPPRALPQTTPAPPAAAPEPRQALVDAVMKQTGLNRQYATMCLEGNNWNLQQALNNFQDLKPSIPPEAYV